MSKIISVESYADLNKVLVLYPFGKLLHFKTGKIVGWGCIIVYNFTGKTGSNDD